MGKKETKTSSLILKNRTMGNSVTFSGKVKFFIQEKGYGFITEAVTKVDYFVHYTSTLDKIQAEDEVEFEVEEGSRGPKAVGVKRKKEIKK